jgi:methionyl-tRNA formyltransferase
MVERSGDRVIWLNSPDDWIDRSTDQPMTRPLNLVFCGTPGFAVPTLTALVGAGFRVPLVVTQPDRPRDRGMDLAPSPVKQEALRLGLPVIQPEKIRNNEELRTQLAAIRTDAIIVVGYGRIIPQWMIDLPQLGNINLHASLLPKYRGAAPVQWAIARGESLTGVTTMRIDAGLDTGDILLQEAMPIEPQDTTLTVGPRLAQIGAGLMVLTLQELEAGTVQSRPQHHSCSSLAPILKKEDGRMDFTRTAAEISNRVRGFQPWPGTFTTFRGKTLNVWLARPVERSVAPGELLVETERMSVGCANDSALELLEVQPQGKKRMPAKAFISGYRPLSGEKLG